MSTRFRRTRAALVLATAAGLAACGGNGVDLADQKPTKSLEVMSWWTSASEKPALESLVDSYKQQHPGVTVKDPAVAGGGGSNVQVVLANRLQAGDPPDVWQTFIGSSTAAYANSDRLADLSAAYPKELVDALPAEILDAVTVGGKRYSMPSGSHRSNMLWFNKQVLSKAGVTPPASGYTLGSFLGDLKKIEDSGAVGLCLGGKDAFASAELFEDVLLSRVGAKGWADITKDRFDWGGSQAKAALRTFGSILDRADPAANSLTWDDALGRLADGKCGFAAFNDTAYAELRAQGADDSTFGYTAFPGTDRSYLAVIDAFVVAADPANARNALDFVKTVSDKDATLKFNKLKGSVPVRTDVDTSSLSDYQRSAASAYRDSTLLLSIAHGEATSPAFQGGFYDAVASYRSSRDAGSFAQVLADAITDQSAVTGY